MRKKLLRPLLALAAIVLVGFGIAFGVQKLRPSVKVVPTTHVKRGTLQLDINTPGELRTPHSAMLVAPSINGALQIVSVATTGTAVKAGDVVVEFDPSEQEYNLEVSRSQLAEAEQEIVKARADAEVKAAEDKVALVKAKFDVRRAELDVSRNELVSDIDAKKNLLSLEEAKRRLAQLEHDVNSRRASNTASIALLEEKRNTALLGMQQAQHGIDSMKLKSPIDGMVSLKENMDSTGGMMFQGMTMPEYREGDIVNPGRFVAEVLDMKQMEAVAKIYESDRPNISVGQPAEIHVDAQPQSSFPAKVKNIAGMASRQNFGTDTIRRFEVTFDLMNHGGDLRPGTSTEIIVRGNEMKDQLYLPSQCLFEKDGKLIIYVKHGDHFEATDARVKFRTENRIVFENVAEGTEVALVNPEEFLKQQQKQSESSPMGAGQ